MPDLTTHALFAHHVLPLLDQSLQDKINLHPQVFVLGAQGPDLLFFRKAVTGNSSLRKFGGMMHHSKVREVFDYMQNTLPSKKGMEREVLEIYCYGYVCHYFLDKIVHPFVYSEEERLKPILSDYSHNALHAKIESEIDSALYAHFTGKPVTEFSVRKEIGVSSSEKWIIAQFYTGLLQTVYGVNAPALEVDRSITEMIRVSSLLYDPTRISYTAGSLVSALIRPLRSTASHMKPKSVAHDVLNLNGRRWQNPSPPSQCSELSVPLLFEQAKQEVLPLLEQIEQTGHFSFDTSLDFSGRFPEAN